MNFKPAKCPTCGGDLQVPSDRTSVNCMYCGGAVMIREATQLAVKDNKMNLLDLARAARESGNNDEAYKYWTQVLEIDADDYEAWYGKAESTGWSSTLSKIRISEMISVLEKAIEHAPEHLREQETGRAAALIDSVSMACHQMAKKHLLKFAGLDETWPEYLVICEEILDSLLRAHSMNPGSCSVLNNIVVICKDNIEGVSFYNSYNTGAAALVKDVHRVSKPYEKKLFQIANDCVLKLQTLDPNYKVPVIRKAGPCFIATAAYGSWLAPEVEFLRAWRDAHLLTNRFGTVAVSIYYTVSPAIASMLAASKTGRRVVRSLLGIVIRCLRAIPSNGAEHIRARSDDPLRV